MDKRREEADMDVATVKFGKYHGTGPFYLETGACRSAYLPHGDQIQSFTCTPHLPLNEPDEGDRNLDYVTMHREARELVIRVLCLCEVILVHAMPFISIWVFALYEEPPLRDAM
jgi:hypothetical protein